MARKDKQNEESQAEDQLKEQQQTGAAGNEEQIAEQNAESDNQPHAESIEQKMAELNDKYVRLYSDFDNFRKRTAKEKADLILHAGGEVIKDLLVVLDDFERAVANNEKVDSADALRESFKLIQHKLVNILQHKGLELLESKGEVFSADQHEAITNVPVQDESQKGKIIDVIERGYNLRGKTLRFAKVVVGQ
ncbi:MAG: nucleotide exchange factor GrpE [Crocinitomicaceae bacterium]|nr:nucleotide exchange factor GrpE [Crocinitomicaceae bacterium]MBK8924320.1 nucleotide exchange factor GrpE [Crocinitomicaceae bacterium]